MSEQKTYTGTIKSTGLALSEFLEENKDKLSAHGLTYIENGAYTYAFDFLHESFVEGKYFIDHTQDNPLVWEFVTLEEYDDPSFCQVERNPDNTVSFTTSFYNGGTGLDEMLSEALAEKGLDE